MRNSTTSFLRMSLSPRNVPAAPLFLREFAVQYTMACQTLQITGTCGVCRLDDQKTTQQDDTTANDLKGSQRFVENEQGEDGAEEWQRLHQRG